MPNQQSTALAAAVATCAAQGWRLEGAYGATATMVSGGKPNHVLHLILTLATCLMWAPVWAIVAATRHTKRLIITVDPYGRVTYRTSLR